MSDSSSTTSASTTTEAPQWGVVVCCGGTSWDTLNRKDAAKKAAAADASATEENLLAPHLMKPLADEKVIGIYSGPAAAHNVAVTLEGKVYTWGRNEFGQLGHGDLKTRKVPTIVKSLEGKKIIKAAVGKNHTLVLTEEGKVYGFGANKFCQLGMASKEAVTKPTQIVKGLPAKAKITHIACGGEFSMVVVNNGEGTGGGVYSFGHPEYGQLGHGSDNKRIAKASKITFDPQETPRLIRGELEGKKILDIACGNNHTLVLDSTGMVYSWGFGGYGRLGHGEQKDLFVPKQIKEAFDARRPVKMIAAGSSYSAAVINNGTLYLWGQVKRTGDAWMRPKPSPDVAGWNIRHVSLGNTSLLMASENSTISWGSPAPYGELGYGPSGPKSSTTARKIDSLEGMYCIKVAAGVGHSLFLIRNANEDDAKKIATLPVYDPQPDKVEASSDAAAATEEEEEVVVVEEEVVEEKEEEKKPAPKKRAPPTKKAAAAAATTTAKKATTASKKRKAEDDDDDDAAADEEEEEENGDAKKSKKKPAAKKGRGAAATTTRTTRSRK